MTDRIDLFLAGQQASDSAPAAALAGTPFRIAEISDTTPTAQTLNEWVDGSTSEVVAFLIDSPENLPAILPPLNERLCGADKPYAVLGIDPDDEIAAWIWSALPARFATLIQPIPLQRPVLLSKSALTNVGAFRDVDEPLWDWCIRAASSEPDKVVCCSCTTPLHSSSRPDLPELAPREPGTQRDWLRDYLYDAAPARSPLLAGLLQLHDYLDESHAVSQGLEGQKLADHWHGIMHRREPDYSNAKYWYRRVGSSPVFAELAERADEILTGCGSAAAETLRQKLHTPRNWDAFAFVDFCQSQARGNDETLSDIARQIQLWEMLLLLRKSDPVMSA